MLVTVSEQCDQKIMAIRDQEKQEMKELRDENRRLYARIDALRDRCPSVLCASAIAFSRQMSLMRSAASLLPRRRFFTAPSCLRKRGTPSPVPMQALEARVGGGLLGRVPGADVPAAHHGHRVDLSDACQRFSHDNAIHLFWDCVEGRVDEEVHHTQLQLIAQLLNQLVRMDAGGQGALSKDDFRAALGEFLETQMLRAVDDDTMNALVKTAEDELGAKDAATLQFKELFMEDDEGRTGAFLDAVKAEVKQNRMRYIDEIKIELGTAQ
jgi:hypothetical protein